MIDIEAQQLLLEIIKYAEEAESSKFQFIKTWDEFKFYRQKYKSSKLVIKVMKRCANNLFKTYYRELRSGVSDVTKVLAYSQFLDIIDFYKHELDTVKLMLDDYDEYLGQGNFWYSVLGGEREIKYTRSMF